MTEPGPQLITAPVQDGEDAEPEQTPKAKKAAGRKKKTDAAKADGVEEVAVKVEDGPKPKAAPRRKKAATQEQAAEEGDGAVKPKPARKAANKKMAATAEGGDAEAVVVAKRAMKKPKQEAAAIEQ